MRDGVEIDLEVEGSLLVTRVDVLVMEVDEPLLRNVGGGANSSPLEPCFRL